MAKRKIKSSFWRNIASLLMLAALLTWVLFMLLSNLAPRRYTLEAGQLATESIYAPRDVEDETATAIARRQASEDIHDRYRLDALVGLLVEQEIDQLFDNCNGAVQEAMTWIQTHPNPDGSLPGLHQADAAFWADVRERYLPADLWGNERDLHLFICTQSPSRLESLRIRTLQAANTALAAGISQDEMAQSLRTMGLDLMITGFREEELHISQIILAACMAPNRILDVEGTEAARQRAADAVEPIMFLRGQPIVLADSIITDNQLSLLSSMGLLTTNSQQQWTLTWGAVLLGLIVTGLGVGYLAVFERAILSRPRELSLLVVILAISLLLIQLLCRINNAAALLGVQLCVLLIAALLHTRMAIVFGVLLSVLGGVVCSGAQGLFDVDMQLFFLAGTFSSMAGVFLLNKKLRRQHLMLAGLGMGIAGALGFTACGLLLGQSFATIMTAVGVSTLVGLVCAVLVLGSLSLWESLFGVVTTMKLLDLANPDHKLLRRLVSEAPGTYSHSVAVANLAEAACDAIGANGLLARVVAYYHDVGKLTRPTYFIENQMGSENPHDKLSPEASARVLREHVTLGEALARRHRLPAILRDGILQHHGTTTMAYFYHKARKANPEGQVDPAPFTYPGPRPQSREAAVVMIADSVEAAVRSMQDPTPAQIEEMVRKVVRAKVDEDQFFDCTITLREIERVIAVLLETLRGAHHERLSYPDKGQK